ncbi:MAG TPA: hypothetical protein VN625_02770, partial [Desulfuromonadaceae bacterium]|nr:hypothetical protein [Desulfuromonadaceae bacterium]
MKTRQIVMLFTGILTLGIFNLSHVHADVVVLNTDQTDYTFQGTNTYYLTGSVYIAGTATFEGGTVIKFGHDIWWPAGIVASSVECQTSLTNPAIFTVCDDDRFGETLPDSTGTLSGAYATTGLEIDCTQNQSIHDLQFYNAGSTVLRLMDWA